MSRLLIYVVLLWLPLHAATVSGHVNDPQAKPAAGAVVRLSEKSLVVAEVATDDRGNFSFASVPVGSYIIEVQMPGFVGLSLAVDVAAGGLSLNLRFSRLASRAEAITVSAGASDPGILSPDPGARIMVRDELLDSPGRPGVPVSIPGIPVETASSGIKAPQYFAPGVAGDHGEPVAQFLRVGDYLVPNNLSANAHGNGYADPNVMVPSVIESMQVDGGAFNVREGNHAVDLAVVYGFRDRLEPFVSVTGDYRDIDVTAGWSPADPGKRTWVAVEASYGNGFLDALEHRQQYKLNGYRTFDIGAHKLTIVGLGYFGQSRIPGLVPIDVNNLHDTIDPRQRDQTHTTEIGGNDIWRLAPGSELQFSGFFRTYNLSLSSNFGDGLIRQSEFRTVTGGQANYVRKVSEFLTVMASADYTRDAPRRLDLDHYLSNDPGVYGPFQKVTANDVTLALISPFAAVDGSLTSWLRYYAGWRRDEIGSSSADLLHPQNSFRRRAGVNSPKATLSFVPPDRSLLPAVSLSFGQTFFTTDPRIGLGGAAATPFSRAHSYQLVASKTLLGTDIRVTLGRVTQEQSLARIDPDTGLQFNQGPPGRNRYVTVSARRYFRGGSLQASVSQADARDLVSGLPLPEAPRMIFDMLGTIDRLPFGLRARAEYEQVGRKSLGDGFTSVPVREFRGALVRQFHNGRMEAGVNFQLASGRTGQTTEVLALPGETGPFERIVGVYLPSYVTASYTYHFRPRSR